MKRLNKIALSVVAVVAVVISGCGADEKNAPTVTWIYGDDNWGLKIKYRIPDFKTQEQTDKWLKNITMKGIVGLEGKRSCKGLKWETINWGYIITPNEDCPPKDRLDLSSYKFGIKTNYGTFYYDGSDKTSKNKYGHYETIGSKR